MAKGRAGRQGRQQATKRDSRGRFIGRSSTSPTVKRGERGAVRAGERASSGRSIAQRVRAVDDAVRTLGSERVKSGAITLGSTRRLTPTHKGFRALDKALQAIQTSYGTRQASLFTFDLSLRYRDAKGKFVQAPDVQGIAFPRLAEVKRARKRGESMAHAFRRLVETQIKAATFRAAQDAPQIANTRELYNRFQRELVKGNKRKAAATLKQLKKVRQLTVKLRIKRVQG